MDSMSYADQHHHFPPGTIVIAADGQRPGILRTVYAHFFLVSEDSGPHTDLEAPPHAVASIGGERLYLTVNRDVVSIVDAQASAARGLRLDDA